MQQLDATFAALADPTRRAMLERLAHGEATVTELGAPFPISQPAVSRHVKVLLDAGLIAQRVDGTKRPCRLASGALPELDAYLALLRRALERNYDRLDALLASGDDDHHDDNVSGAAEAARPRKRKDER